MEFTVSSAQAHGSNSQIGLGAQSIKFEGAFGQSFDIDAEDLYETSTMLGFNYGRLINDNILFNVGFSFVDIKHEEVFEDAIYIYTYPDFFKLRMYNVDFNWNYYFMSPIKESFAPYAGIGLQTGLLSVNVDGYASESDFVTSTAFNFGADIAVWKSPDKMSQMSISSVNSYQFYASDSRPTYLTIGVGLKYFFRP